MTRKRFVKMVMARGFGRNNAEELAYWLNLFGASYEELFQMVWKPAQRLIQNQETEPYRVELNGREIEVQLTPNRLNEGKRIHIPKTKILEDEDGNQED